MKKSDSRQDKEALHEELKRLRKENRKLVSQKEKLKTKYDKAQKELNPSLTLWGNFHKFLVIFSS